MAADNVSVPAPDFVTPAIGVVIGSATLMSPAPVSVSAGVPLEAVNESPDTTLNVSVPAVLPTVASAPRFTVPVIEFAFARLRSAPVDVIPVPEW